MRGACVDKYVKWFIVMVALFQRNHIKMKTFLTSQTISSQHIDEGNHANWLAQLKIAEDVHFQIRQNIGLDLETLKTKDMFLVMGMQSGHWINQIRLGEEIQIEMSIWVYSRTRLGFHAIFRRGVKVLTELDWMMPLIKISTGKPIAIPEYIKSKIET